MTSVLWGVIKTLSRTGHGNMGTLSVPRHLVHVLEVAAEVTALSESLLAHGTVERSLTSVLSEVIS